MRLNGEKRKGLTKETHEGLRKISETKKGRTKETCPGHLATSIALTGRTKEQYQYLEEAASKKRILPNDLYPIIKNKRLEGISIKAIHEWIISLGYEITYSGVRGICKRNY